MSYYWFNRQDLLKKAKKEYHKVGGKEKASEYYQKNRETIKKESKKQIQKFKF